LESTTVVAPRDGVVTLKYAEEGTVIPAGVSQFSERANIVQLSDVTILYVDCTVDEADISMIREGQKARIVAEAFPGVKIDGVVTRVNPAATTVNSVTSVTVRVELRPKADHKVRLLPGMNATCEFITMSKPNVRILPSQALKSEDGKTFVLVKGPDPKKPVRKEVQVGESGNDGVELLSGLDPDDEVVIAEINLKQLREMQQRMQEAQQGGGLAGGGGRSGPRTMGGTTGGGGSRGGMGGGTGGGR
jgi:HlyD family secretion protein